MRLVTIRAAAQLEPGSSGNAGPPDASRTPDERLAVALGRGRLAILLDADRILPVGALADVAPTQLPEEVDRLDLPALLAEDPDLGALRDALESADPEAVASVAVPASAVRLGPPVTRPGKIVCVGQNYMDHIREQGIEPPSRPVLFAKFANAVVAGGEPVRHPAGTHALDLEAELAVVVGRPAHAIRAADWRRYVAGYTVANDITARDWQGQKSALRPGERGDGQWLRAKGSDTFLPLGPALVTADEVRDPEALAVRSWRISPDGEQPMQNGTTADMIWSIGELLAFVSASITLEPGDVLLTGTPNGVGAFRDPPVWLVPGDVARVEVAGIGTLTSPIAGEDGAVPDGSPAARLMGQRFHSDVTFRPSSEGRVTP